MSAEAFRVAFPGEGQLVEFKRGSSGEQLQNTAVAFSNADGGVILIGVADDGEVVGRQADAETQDAIHQSPGALPEPVTVENIREASAARNLTVIKILRSLGLAADTGRGVDVMQDTMTAEMLDPLSFQDNGHEVMVELPIRSAVTPASDPGSTNSNARGAPRTRSSRARARRPRHRPHQQDAALDRLRHRTRDPAPAPR